MSRSFIAVSLFLILLIVVIGTSTNSLIRIAAEQGYAPAQFHLGVMYEYGQGMPQDDLEAANWYQKSAEQGYVDAQFSLGIMHYAGQGVPQDFVLAYVPLSLAAASGDEQALHNRDRVAYGMTPEQIEEGEAIVKQWQPGQPLPTVSKTGRRNADSMAGTTSIVDNEPDSEEALAEIEPPRS
ncbi:MAG: sel1 repeat family protein [Betaproteobacteria bacterium]|nr:sel1 repeat family protein [Betaproteobacteria bacterium]